MINLIRHLDQNSLVIQVSWPLPLYLLTKFTETVVKNVGTVALLVHSKH
jgi:hypothetical protein